MKQVVVIHGGDTFGDDEYEKYLAFLREFNLDFKDVTTSKSGWKTWLRDALGSEYDVALPQMPNSFNARFVEWKIWFEKIFPYLNDGVMLVGHSMGGAFLAKYLSENNFPKQIGGVFLVAAVHEKDGEGNPLHTFALPEKLDLQTDKIFLYHSKDDSIVPIEDLNKYKSSLPKAIAREFEDKGHFRQAEFPELLEDIKNLG